MPEDNVSLYLEESRQQLIDSLKAERILKSKHVEEAIRSVPREAFIDQDASSRAMAYLDEPLPLGASGQTISAPHMVVMMLEELELRPGLKVLEIGGGSGYNAALIGHIISGGQNTGAPLVVSIERDEKLAEYARNNIHKVGLSKVVDIVAGDGSLGYPQEAPEEIYDRIVVTAGAPRVPHFLKMQLKTNGILLAPVGGRTFQKLVRLRKKKDASGKIDFTEEKLVDCLFVPLIGADAHAA